MASYTVTYLVQSCPVCKTQLLKFTPGTKTLGSPLVTCKGCGRTYRTEARTEWYNYSKKRNLWLLPLIMGVIMGLLALLGGGLLTGLLVGGGFAGFFLALIYLIVLPAIIKSKKRMKDPAYLELLLQHGVISETEHEEFMRKAS